MKVAYRERCGTIFETFVSENSDIVVPDADFACDIGWLPLVREAVKRMRTYLIPRVAALHPGRPDSSPDCS